MELKCALSIAARPATPRPDFWCRQTGRPAGRGDLICSARFGRDRGGGSEEWIDYHGACRQSDPVRPYPDPIAAGIEEGATLVIGGPGRPAGLNRGYYAQPTVFADVRNDMRIAQEEIFGPVLSILPYRDEEDAIRIANDTVYGLSSYVTSSDMERSRRVARRIRAGMVHLNGAQGDTAAAFGGYKQSGNGREWGRFGFEEFLEVKLMLGFVA